MKLSIKKEWFDKVKAGVKEIEYRDAHITFVCEETGEVIQKRVYATHLLSKSGVPKDVLDSGCIEDDDVICFYLDQKRNGDKV